MSLTHNRWSNGNAADTHFSVGSSNPGQLTLRGGGGGGGGGGSICTQPGFEPPTKRSTVSCITTRPLLDLVGSVSPLLATDKKPKLCVSV